MDEYIEQHKAKSLDRIFSALGHAARREILRLLAEDEYRVTELAQKFDLSLNVVSKHIKVLERAGLIQREKEGRVHRIRLDPNQLADAADWLDRYKAFWQQSLESMSEYVDQIQPKESEE